MIKTLDYFNKLNTIFFQKHGDEDIVELTVVGIDNDQFHVKSLSEPGYDYILTQWDIDHAINTNRPMFQTYPEAKNYYDKKFENEVNQFVNIYDELPDEFLQYLFEVTVLHVLEYNPSHAEGIIRLTNKHYPQIDTEAFKR